jgi:Sigma-70, region 4
VGPWLPEPVVDDDPAEASATADSVSFALLTVLESLSPLERTVFILRDAFAYPYQEIAGILDRSEPAVRQLARRARAHVRDRSPRYDVDTDMQRDVTERFLDASIGGRLDELLTLLAPDVELVSDTAGIARAPRRVVVGSDKVARFVVAVAQEPGLFAEFARINGEVGVLIRDRDSKVRYRHHPHRAGAQPDHQPDRQPRQAHADQSREHMTHRSRRQPYRTAARRTMRLRQVLQMLTPAHPCRRRQERRSPGAALRRHPGATAHRDVSAPRRSGGHGGRVAHIQSGLPAPVGCTSRCSGRRPGQRRAGLGLLAKWPVVGVKDAPSEPFEYDVAYGRGKRAGAVAPVGLA